LRYRKISFYNKYLNNEGIYRYLVYLSDFGITIWHNAFLFTVCFFDIASAFILISDYFIIMGFLLHGFWNCEERHWIKWTARITHNHDRLWKLMETLQNISCVKNCYHQSLYANCKLMMIKYYIEYKFRIFEYHIFIQFIVNMEMLTLFTLCTYKWSCWWHNVQNYWWHRN
jgi:hypothetical protein